MAKSNGQYDHQFSVRFSGVSIGETSARLGFRSERPKMKPTLADKLFSGKQLDVEIYCDDGDQERLPGMEDELVRIKTVCDVKGYSVNAKAISGGLTFNLESVEVEQLARFANRQNGTIKASLIGEIPESKGDDDE